MEDQARVKERELGVRKREEIFLSLCLGWGGVWGGSLAPIVAGLRGGSFKGGLDLDGGQWDVRR